MAHVLRDFLYLDTSIVDNYLAAIGNQFDEKIVETREKSGGLSGEVGISPAKIGGELGSKSIVEVTRQPVLSDAAKFQRLYTALESFSSESSGVPLVQYHEFMNPQLWDALSRDAVIEVLGNLALSKLTSLVQASKWASRWNNIAQTITGQSFISESDRPKIDLAEQVSEATVAEKGLPVILKFAGSPEYKLVSYLNPQYLKVALGDLTRGQVTIFCKVQSKLNSQGKLELFDPLEAVESIGAGRAARRKAQSAKKNQQPPDVIRDTIRAPAAVVLPIAIYR